MWYSDRRSPKTRFSTVVRKRLATYFHFGMPPASGSPRNRLPEHQVLLAAEDRGDQVGDPGRVVLVVGVEHHDDVGALLEGGLVARLLVAAVAQVLLVDDHVEAELAGDVDGLVLRHVVDEDDPVDEIVGDVRVRPLERLRGVVGGHDDDDPRVFVGRADRAPGDGVGWAVHESEAYSIGRACKPLEHRSIVPRRGGWSGPDRPARPSCGRHGRRAGCGRMTADAQALGDTMFERLFGGREMDPATAERIPPGQYKTDKFPVLHYGSVPRTDLATWDFRVYGEVDNPFTLTWDQFKALPRKTVHTDIHCVTRWTKLDTDWEGVPIQQILELAQVRPSATHVVSPRRAGLHGQRPAGVLDDDDVLLADTFGGQPLELEHGYPLRLLIPKRYFWKSSKWVRGLEFLDHDQLGFWERYGYNNDADPWKEERFSE